MPYVSHKNEFYAILPSNSSMDYYPTNRPGSFTVQLKKPISLQGEWEVAMAEIQYQHTWYNITKPVNIEYTSGTRMEWLSFDIPEGNYHLTSLMNRLNALLGEILSSFRNVMSIAFDSNIRLICEVHEIVQLLHITGN